MSSADAYRTLPPGPIVGLLFEVDHCRRCTCPARTHWGTRCLVHRLSCVEGTLLSDAEFEYTLSQRDGRGYVSGADRSAKRVDGWTDSATRIDETARVEAHE